MKSKVVALFTGAGLAAAGFLLAGATTGAATAAGPTGTSGAVLAQAGDTTSCNGVLHGEGEGRLDKRLTSVQEASNGTYDFTFTLTSERSPGTYRIRDCVYVDNGTPGYQGEAVIAGVDQKNVAFTSGANGSTASFTVRVTGIGPNQLVCDRAAVSGVDGTTGFTDKSNEVCVDPNNPPVVPEAPLAIALPLVGLVAVGGVWLLRRRRAAALPA